MEFLRSAGREDAELLRELESLLGPGIPTQDVLASKFCFGDLPSLGPTHLFSAGELLAERYRIESFVAEGGMGEVYKALDQELGLPVAVKATRPGLVSHPERLRRFKQEIMLARLISHRNICRVYGTGRHQAANGPEVHYFTMEYLPGETLWTRIRSRGPLSPRQALPLVRQLTDALSAAHQAGVIHGDFKSANVILVPGPDGERAVVTDFGLAVGQRTSEGAARIPAIAWGGGRDRSRFGPSGESGATLDDVAREIPWERVAGTPAYMAPEQVRGEPIGPAADLYALGVVLFELVTGTLPFHGHTPYETALARLTREPPRPSTLAPVSAEWEAAILRLMAADPADRFVEAAEAQASLEGRPVSGARAGCHLPAEYNDFVGRRRELVALAADLEPRGALVTLQGPAGAGKTRTACRYGRDSRHRWPGGVWFCSLAEARSVDDLVAALARVLEVPLGKGDPIAQLGHALAGHGRALIILDHLDNVRDHAVPILSRWTARSRETTFLVTSRAELGVPGETVVLLDAFDREEDGVELFALRARAHRPDFELTDGNRAAVVEISRLAGRMPLAIELAATRMRTMGPDLLLARLRELQDRRGRTVAAGAAGVPAVVDRSWALLEPWERGALEQARVFDGGFTLEAAESVLDLDPWREAPAVIDVVQVLADQGWLRIRMALGSPRFVIPSVMREYVESKLRTAAAAGATAVRGVEGRHGSFFARLGSRAELEALDRHGGVARFEALTEELPNLRSACLRAVARGEPELASTTLAAAMRVLQVRGPLQAAVELAETVTRMPGIEERIRAVALRRLGVALDRAGRGQEAARVLEQSLSLHRLHGDRAAVGDVLGHLGTLNRDQGKMKEARRACQESLAIRRELGDQHGSAANLDTLGILDHLEGRMDEAKRLHEEALMIYRKLGDRFREGLVLGNLGNLCLRLGRGEEARDLYQGALRILQEIGARRELGATLGNVAIVYKEQGRLDEGQTLYEEALRIHREIGNRPHEGLTLGNLGSLLARRSRYAEARQHYESALAIHLETGDRRFQAATLVNLGILQSDRGRLEEARSHYETAARIYHELGNRRAESALCVNLGNVDEKQGRSEEALGHYQRALALARETHSRRDEGIALGNMAILWVNRRRLDEAERCCAQALEIHREVGNRIDEVVVLATSGMVHAARDLKVEARQLYEEAISVLCQIGERHAGGWVLRLRAELDLQEKRLPEARDALARGERLLREAGAPLALADLLCTRCECDSLFGDAEAARAALKEAASIVEESGLPPQSHLGLKLAALQGAWSGLWAGPKRRG